MYNFTFHLELLVTHFNNRGCATPQRWLRASSGGSTRWSGCGVDLDGREGAGAAAQHCPCPCSLHQPFGLTMEFVGSFFTLCVSTGMSLSVSPLPWVMGCSVWRGLALLHCSTLGLS